MIPLRAIPVCCGAGFWMVTSVLGYYFPDRRDEIAIIGVGVTIIVFIGLVRRAKEPR